MSSMQKAKLGDELVRRLAAALRGALRRLTSSPEVQFDLAARGRQRVLDCYTDARIAQATFHIWREVLSR